MLFDTKNIKEFSKTQYNKIRNFLLSDKSREFLIFLFFVVVSFCFWGLKMLDDNYQTEFTIPLKLKNVPKDVIITSELQNEVKVRVEDRGTVLMNYMLGRSFLPVFIDFEEYKKSGPNVIVPHSELIKKVSAQLNTSTKLTSLLPDSIGFIYSEGIMKKVPVMTNGKITPAMQYYISDIKISPDSVIVYAPQYVLDNIQSAYISQLDCENISEETKRNVPLKRIEGAKFEPSTCNVSISVDMYSEKTLEIPIEGIDFPKGKTLRTFPSKAQVTLQVGLKDYQAISASDFCINVDYNDINTKNEKVKLKVKSYTDKVSHIRINPSEVEYLIEETSNTATEYEK